MITFCEVFYVRRNVVLTGVFSLFLVWVAGLEISSLCYPSVNHLHKTIQAGLIGCKSKFQTLFCSMTEYFTGYIKMSCFIHTKDNLASVAYVVQLRFVPLKTKQFFHFTCESYEFLYIVFTECISAERSGYNTYMKGCIVRISLFFLFGGGLKIFNGKQIPVIPNFCRWYFTCFMVFPAYSSSLKSPIELGAAASSGRSPPSNSTFKYSFRLFP